MLKVDSYPECFDVFSDESGIPQTIWVANAIEGSISIIDFASGDVTATIPVGLTTANRLRFTPNGELALISREQNGDLAVIDVATRTVIREIPVGTGASGIFISPDGGHAYVSCSPDKWVAVVDLKTMSVVGKILPGQDSDGRTWVVRR